MNKILHLLLLLSIFIVHTHAEIAFPSYPKKLNQKTWDKAINIEEVDGDEDDEALESEESIGALLRNIKKIYDKIDLEDFDPLAKQGLKDWNVITLDAFKDEAIANTVTKPKKLRQKVDILVEELKELKKEWKRSRVISKNDKKDLDNTLEDAQNFAKKLKIKSLKASVKAVFKDVEGRLARRLKGGWTGTSTVLNDLEGQISTMTATQYSDFLTQKVPLMKKTFAMIFGNDSDLYEEFENIVIEVDNDDDAKVQSQRIFDVGRNLLLHASLKQMGMF